MCDFKRGSIKSQSLEHLNQEDTNSCSCITSDSFDILVQKNRLAKHSLLSVFNTMRGKKTQRSKLGLQQTVWTMIIYF